MVEKAFQMFAINLANCFLSTEAKDTIDEIIIDINNNLLERRNILKKVIKDYNNKAVLAPSIDVERLMQIYLCEKDFLDNYDDDRLNDINEEFYQKIKNGIEEDDLNLCNLTFEDIEQKLKEKYLEDILLDVLDDEDKADIFLLYESLVIKLYNIAVKTIKPPYTFDSLEKLNQNFVTYESNDITRKLFF